MRLKTVAIQNFRLLADAHITIPSGLTLVNGENGLGKSSIFQAILWCLYGPDALGDNQTSLVRQGTRNMEVTVTMDLGVDIFTVGRKFSLAPNGKSGHTELSVLHDSHIGIHSDMSGGTVAEAQEVIATYIGPLKVFMATAYVDQHDGPGAFLRSKPAEQRQQLRDLLNISPNWDQWFELAKLKQKTVAERIIGNLGRVGAAQEFIDQNAGAGIEEGFLTIDVQETAEKIHDLNLNLEDLQEAQDEVDKVVAENWRRTDALVENQKLIDAAVFAKTQANNEHGRLDNKVEALPALSEERTTWLKQCDLWDDRNTEYHRNVGRYDMHFAEWNVTNSQLLDLHEYYLNLGHARYDCEIRIEDINGELSESPPETHCPVCTQKLLTEESRIRAHASRKKMADERDELATQLKAMNVPVSLHEIKDTGAAHIDNKPVAPVSSGTRPIFESENEYNSAKAAENDIAAVDAEIKTRAEQVDTLSLAREQLPTPDEYDTVGYTARAQTITVINRDITQAETDKLDRERKLAAAENTLELIETRKTEIVTLEQNVTDDQKLSNDLDIVVTGTGPNGARQLMIDQLLGDFQAEVNEWLHVLLPGFSIYMDTQAESGRETFETTFATPTGVIGWHGLSGAQRVGVGLSIRRALASMYAQRTGHSFETWIIDEADGAMRGEKREAFVAMLYKLQESGIDVLVVSHADTVVERLEQRIEVIDAGGYTVVR